MSSQYCFILFCVVVISVEYTQVIQLFMACLRVVAATRGFCFPKDTKTYVAVGVPLRRCPRQEPSRKPISPMCKNKAGDFPFFPQQLSTFLRFLYCINDGVDVEFVIHEAGGECAPQKNRNGVDQELHRVHQGPVCTASFTSREEGGIKKQKTRRLLEIDLTPFECIPSSLLFETTSFLHGIYSTTCPRELRLFD